MLFRSPTGVCFSELQGSNQFTSKIRSFEILQNKEFDFVIMSRLDLHWFKPITELKIQYSMFNLLFKEKDVSHLNWTCDNLYMWPGKWTGVAHKAMIESYQAYRELPDTHGLFNKLVNYISPGEIVVLSDIEQYSHDNLFYSICKAEHQSNVHPVHPEVLERFS